MSPRDEVPARGVDTDRVEQLVEEHDVPTPFRHLLGGAALDEVDELVDEHLQRLTGVSEHLRERLESRDVSVVVRAEHVDQAIEVARVLASDVRGVGGEVRRLASRADENAILVVSVSTRPSPERIVVLERVEERDRLGDLGLDDALPLPCVEVHAEALERGLDPREHRRHGIAGKRRELRDVLAPVATLGRLLAAAHRLDRGVEQLHLGAGVVVVVLALDIVAGEREEPRDRVSVRAVPRRRDGDRPGGVRGNHLHLDALSLRSRGGSERVHGLHDLAHAAGEPGVGQPQIHESGAGGLRALRDPLGDDARRELVRDLARRALLQTGKLERDVRRVVAVLWITGALERDGRTRALRERSGEACDGIHPAIVRRRCAGLEVLGGCRGRRRDRNHDAVAMERELHFLARLVDPPLHRRERDLEGLGDLGVGEPDDVAQEKCHLEIGIETFDRSPDGVDRLRTLGRCVDHLEWRHVVEVHDGARTTLDRTQLVEDAVLRDLEQPRREPRAEREARKTLEHPQEDLLRQILGEAPVARQPKDVVEHRLLVRPNDDRKRTLIASLSLAKHAEVWLWQRHARGV